MLPFMCVQSSAGVSVLCVSFTLLPPLPSCSNAVETLMQQSQLQAPGCRGAKRKWPCQIKETLLPVIYCML